MEFEPLSELTRDNVAGQVRGQGLREADSAVVDPLSVGAAVATTGVSPGWRGER